ncbi:MAG TPA: hypothetical protein ENI80_07830 [Acidiferrobacteraceae bacterium]|nr:hypothetical protein [Acidiferrobacteraceae bacterium]
MLISLLLIATSLALLFSIKDRIQQRSKLFRYGVVGVLILLTAALATMEFMIYVHERIKAFLEAAAGVPLPVVGAIFLLFLVFSTSLFIWVGTLNRDSLRHLLYDTFMPKAREAVGELARSGRSSWREFMQKMGGWLRRRVVTEVKEQHRPESKEKGSK